MRGCLALIFSILVSGAAIYALLWFADDNRVGKIERQIYAVAGRFGWEEATRAPVPTPTRRTVLSNHVHMWTDEWVDFTVAPTVCLGELSVAGVVKNGAILADSDKTVSPFVIYGGDDLPHFYGGARRILSFGPQPPPGWGQRVMPPQYQLPSQVIASPENPEFKLISVVPADIDGSPQDYALAIIGRRQGERAGIIRLAWLQTCE